MKKLYFILPLFLGVNLGCMAQGCVAYLNDGVAKLKKANIDIPTLNELEIYFSNVDTTCRDEIGNSAALYAAQVREMKSSILAKARTEELRRKEQAKKLAEEERLELERIRREKEERISKNLIFIDGYGRMQDGSEFPIVRLIKAELTKYGFKFTSKPERAVWSIYIAIDTRDVRETNQGDYFAIAVPLMMIDNVIEDENYYDGSGIDESFFYEDSDYQDGMIGRAPKEVDAIYNSFFATIKPLSKTIEKTVPHE